MNNLEAIWWETQDIDVNKNRIGNPTLHVHLIRKMKKVLLMELYTLKKLHKVLMLTQLRMK